jgi:galactofuranose transport system substrate-binding protein
MKRGRLILVAIVLILVVGAFASAQKRDPAPKGEPITPRDFPAEFLPGITEPGAVPLKKYFIAFSNGDMGDVWRRTFTLDIEAWALKYVKTFDIKWIWTNAGNNSALQVSQAQSLLSMKPDLLFVSPNESEPLMPVLQMANKMKIPVIALDREFAIKAEEPNDMYVQVQSMDYYQNGVATGLGILMDLKEKYGKPQGNVVEIAGILGSSPGIQRSQGLHWVLDNYPDIHIIASRPGDFDRRKGYEHMRDLLEAYKPGQIDAVHVSCDAMGLGALKAIQEKGRTELIGHVHGIDGDTPALQGILDGTYGTSHECSPYYGMTAFEYAIRYLNGEKIPARVMLPTRWFTAFTPERKAELQRLVTIAEDGNLPFPPLDAGGQVVLSIPDVKKVYGKPWWEDAAKTKVKSYTEAPPFKTPAWK